MSMDLILCRDVVGWFAALAARQIVGRLRDCLIDNGWLIVGRSEHSLVSNPGIRARMYPGAIVYQRSESPSKPSRDPLVLAGGKSSSSASAESTSFSAWQPEEAMRQAAPATSLLSDDNSIERAEGLLDHGHSGRARALLLGLAAARPPQAPECVLLARACSRLGYWEEAEIWCHKAIHLDKLALTAYHTLGLVLQHQGQCAKAIEMITKAIFIDGRHVPAHLALAELYHASGQLAEALKSLDNAYRLLRGEADDALVPGAEGVTAGRLREDIVHKQQRWSVDA
jgi:chemotaxis protein methyltransferase CheR